MADPQSFIDDVLSGISGEAGQIESLDPNAPDAIAQYMKAYFAWIKSLYSARVITGAQARTSLMSMTKHIEESQRTGATIESFPDYEMLRDRTQVGEMQRWGLVQQARQAIAEGQARGKALGKQVEAEAKAELERYGQRLTGEEQRVAAAVTTSQRDELGPAPTGEKDIEKALAGLSPNQRAYFAPILAQKAASLQGAQAKWFERMNRVIGITEEEVARRGRYVQRAGELGISVPNLDPSTFVTGGREAETPYEQYVAGIASTFEKGERLHRERGVRDPKPTRSPIEKLAQDYPFTKEWMSLGGPRRRGESPGRFRPSARFFK